MNWDEAKGKWQQFRGEAQKQWGKLTNDDYDMIEGDRKKFVGRIQEIYGITTQEAEKQIDDFVGRF